jgi:uncharacterized membrane protein YccC
MADAKTRKWLHAEEKELVHAARTAVAAVASLLLARLLRLPESYWAAVTSMIVMQSTLGAAWTVSKQRLAGTALGAAMGALAATYAGSNVAVFGAGVFLCGVICALLHIERNAFRYAGVTMAIILLVARTAPAWVIALHRFVEISVGIAVGLIVTAAWPESQPASA